MDIPNDFYWIFVSIKIALPVAAFVCSKLNRNSDRVLSIYSNFYTYYLLTDLLLSFCLGLGLIFQSYSLSWSWITLIILPALTIVLWFLKKPGLLPIVFVSLAAFMFLMIDNYLDFRQLGFRTICALFNFMNIIGFNLYLQRKFDTETLEVRSHSLSLLALGGFHLLWVPVVLALSFMGTIFFKFWRVILVKMLE